MFLFLGFMVLWQCKNLILSQNVNISSRTRIFCFPAMLFNLNLKNHLFGNIVIIRTLRVFIALFRAMVLITSPTPEIVDGSSDNTNYHPHRIDLTPLPSF